VKDDEAQGGTGKPRKSMSHQYVLQSRLLFNAVCRKQEPSRFTTITATTATTTTAAAAVADAYNWCLLVRRFNGNTSVSRIWKCVTDHQPKFHIKGEIQQVKNKLANTNDYKRNRAARVSTNNRSAVDHKKIYGYVSKSSNDPFYGKCFLFHRRRNPKKDDLRPPLGAINIGTWFLCVIEICKRTQMNRQLYETRRQFLQNRNTMNGE
jgi:hypothetical protein